MSLTEQEKQRLIQLIEQGKPLPAHYKNRLFADEADYVERTAVYELQYKGKKSEPDILSRTPAAPLQEMRSFNSDNPFEDDWRNLLIFGDNLLALKAIYNDQRGSNRYGTKNRIKPVYIDPPFATKQDLMFSATLPDSDIQRWLTWAEWMVRQFHRSSSAVEGRNGCLAQLYHNGEV